MSALTCNMWQIICIYFTQVFNNFYKVYKMFYDVKTTLYSYFNCNLIKNLFEVSA